VQFVIIIVSCKLWITWPIS